MLSSKRLPLIVCSERSTISSSSSSARSSERDFTSWIVATPGIVRWPRAAASSDT
jgi:hypothetical protein